MNNYQQVNASFSDIPCLDLVLFVIFLMGV